VVSEVVSTVSTSRDVSFGQWVLGRVWAWGRVVWV